MAKVNVTFITKESDELGTCAFPPRWLPTRPKSLGEAVEAWWSIPFEDWSRQRWEAIRPSDEDLDLAWKSERIKIHLDIRTELPKELRSIYDRIINEGPHRVLVPKSMLEVISRLLEPEACAAEQLCDYELVVFCRALIGLVD